MNNYLKMKVSCNKFQSSIIPMTILNDDKVRRMFRLGNFE